LVSVGFWLLFLGTLVGSLEKLAGTGEGKSEGKTGGGNEDTSVRCRELATDDGDSEAADRVGENEGSLRGADDGDSEDADLTVGLKEKSEDNDDGDSDDSDPIIEFEGRLSDAELGVALRSLLLGGALGCSLGVALDSTLGTKLGKEDG
jgi:hypothetical protein